MSKERDKLKSALFWRSSTFKELKDHVSSLSIFLRKLERVDPENAISAKLRPLFVEACNIAYSHWKDEGRASDIMMKMISEVMEIFKPEIIGERIKASKPSRSSSTPITMQMVWFVSAMLHWCDVSVHELQEKLRYPRSFLKLTVNRCIEHESMKDLFAHVEDIAYTAQQLRFLAMAGNKDSEFFALLQRISPFRPELRHIYLSLLIESKSSSTSEPTLNPENMHYFVEALREDLEVAFDRPPQWLKDGLHTPFYFVFHTEVRRIPLEGVNSLKSHCEALAIEAAIVIYSSYDKKMDMKTTTEIDHVLFPVRHKFSHVKVETDLIKLHRQATIRAPHKNLIGYVREELIL